MFMTFIDLDQPHLSVFYTKKYYNKKFGTNLRSLKKLKNYYKRYYTRQIEDLFNHPIHPMGKPSGHVFYAKPVYIDTNKS